MLKWHRVLSLPRCHCHCWCCDASMDFKKFFAVKRLALLILSHARCSLSALSLALSADKLLFGFSLSPSLSLSQLLALFSWKAFQKQPCCFLLMHVCVCVRERERDCSLLWNYLALQAWNVFDFGHFQFSVSHFFIFVLFVLIFCCLFVYTRSFCLFVCLASTSHKRVCHVHSGPHSDVHTHVCTACMCVTVCVSSMCVSVFCALCLAFVQFRSPALNSTLLYSKLCLSCLCRSRRCGYCCCCAALRCVAALCHPAA